MSEKNSKNTFKIQYPDLIKPFEVQLFNKSDEDLTLTYNFAKTSPLQNAAGMAINGRRPSMEDYAVINHNGDLQFYGVFDGHGGWKIAAILANELSKRLFQISDLDYTDPIAVTDAVRNICWILGKEIYDLSDCDSCGSTAVFAIRYKQYVYLVNIGDSAGVLFDSEGKILIRTKDHKPYDPEEKIRIEKRGSYVSNNRVNGCLAVSRSFGDNIYNYGSNLKQSRDKSSDYAGFETIVSHEPDIYPFVIPEGEKIYLVLGSDGFWDCCSFEKEFDSKFNFNCVTEIVTSEPPLDAGRKLVDMAYKTGVYDNITVIIASF